MSDKVLTPSIEKKVHEWWRAGIMAKNAIKNKFLLETHNAENYVSLFAF